MREEVTDRLYAVFLESFADATTSEEQLRIFWNQIASAYTDRKRHYHTLDHLEHLYEELSEVKENITDWNTLICTLFYHDMVYSPRSFKNELKSAELAGEHLRSIGVSEEKIEKCRDQILATKHHRKSEDKDTNYFLDADLSILGATEDTYGSYVQNIRKEYKLVPRGIYRKGRKKVIRNFLAMEQIYKTDHFYNKYEDPARANLSSELEKLQ